MKTNRSSEQGSALLFVLGWISLLLPATAWIASAAWIELLQAQNSRRAVSAFYVAEAGLARALVWVVSRSSAEEALRGPDGVAGTADDGGAFGPPALFVPYGQPPWGGYSVRVDAVAPDTVRVRSDGTGWGGGTRRVEAVVRWRTDGTVSVRWVEAFDS